jgi:hypothetical protein
LTTTIDGGLELAYIHDVTARVEHEAAAGLNVSTGVIWRGERQHGTRQSASWPFEAFSVPVTIEDPGPDAVKGTPDDGPPIQVFDLPGDLVDQAQIIVRNLPYAETDHLTWEAVARRRFSGNWSMFVSVAHTWNRDHASGYFGQPVRANEFPLTPNDFIHTDGRGRHRYRDWSIRILGTWEAPWKMRITPFLRHQSGQAFGRTLLTPRLNYGNIRVLAEPVGSRRQDHLTVVDVKVDKTIQVAGATRLRPFVEVFNALNTNAAQNIRWDTGANFLSPIVIVPPRIARVGISLDW